MKVLTVNKYYYLRGGDCIYTIELEALLKSKGNEVAVFAMSHPSNLATTWDKYFPPEVDFNRRSDFIRAALRPLGVSRVAHRFATLLDDFKPDVVHFNNIHSQLSPSIVKVAHDCGIRTVWTMHDYKLLCPAYLCQRNDGTACELCFTDKRNVVRHRCLKGSTAASLLAWAEAVRWSRKRLEPMVDRFICPSRFMADKMVAGGFSAEKIAVLPNFIYPEMAHLLGNEALHSHRNDYYCYVGRISREKGIGTLLRAASRLPYRLLIAGDGPELPALRREYAESANIAFLGNISRREVAKLLSGARFSVMPSEWYENNPLGVIESLCAGTPVVGANIGGIPELIDSQNGTLFESGNIDSLSEAINRAYKSDADYGEISRRALKRFDSNEYYSALSKIYH